MNVDRCARLAAGREGVTGFWGFLGLRSRDAGQERGWNEDQDKEPFHEFLLKCLSRNAQLGRNCRNATASDGIRSKYAKSWMMSVAAIGTGFGDAGICNQYSVRGPN